MSFDDLPDNWTDLPLDTPGLGADVADLVVGVADRESGCLGLLLTDERRRLLQPLVVGGVTDGIDPDDIATRLESVLLLLREVGGALVFVRGRDGAILVTDADRRWLEVVLAACQRHEVPLIGAWLATPSGVRPFPAGLAEQDVLAS
jgi:hypothetical protein